MSVGFVALVVFWVALVVSAGFVVFAVVFAPAVFVASPVSVDAIGMLAIPDAFARPEASDAPDAFAVQEAACEGPF